MEQVYVFHLTYYDESPSNGDQLVAMAHGQHARSTELVIDVQATSYESALQQAKEEYRRRNFCNVFGGSRPIRVVHCENA